MLLAIDIGNTTISLGCVKGGRVVKTYDIPTASSAKQVHLQLKRLLGKILKKFHRIDGVVICSVVPSVLKYVCASVKQLVSCPVSVIGKDIRVPIKNNYRHPKQVGQDRLLCAYAVKTLYGRPAIVIDFGTAITFDVVSHRGEYEGGMIIPGIQMSADSLYQKTALLPRIDKIRAPRSLVGKDTKHSILSGIFYGYGAMSQGLIDMISRSLRGKPKVIVTGGYTHLMKKFVANKVNKIDPHLVFKGMYLLVK